MEQLSEVWMGNFNKMNHEGMACGTVGWAEQVQEECDVQNLAYTIGNLQFYETLYHFFSN